MVQRSICTVYILLYCVPGWDMSEIVDFRTNLLFCQVYNHSVQVQQCPTWWELGLAASASAFVRMARSGCFQNSTSEALIQAQNIHSPLCGPVIARMKIANSSGSGAGGVADMSQCPVFVSDR